MTSTNQAPLDLRDYLAILWARKWIVLGIVVTTTAVALFYSYQQTPTYTSSAEVVVRPARFDPSQPSTAFGFLNMSTEQQVANSLSVAQLASTHLAGLGVQAGRVSASVVEDAEAIVFASESSDPASAQALANVYAKSYLELRRDKILSELAQVRQPYATRILEIGRKLRWIVQTLSTTTDESQKLVLTTRYTALLSERADQSAKLDALVPPENVRVGDLVQSAKFPTSPSSPNHTKDGALGLIVGLALGVGVAFLWDRLDDRVRGREELELYSGAPVLAFIPHVAGANGSPITIDEPASEAAEAYKALRVRLLQAAAQHRFKTVVVTSSLAGEGKTSTAANLGVVLAQAEKRVVLLAADLRRPHLQTFFRKGEYTGLTEVLTGKRKMREAMSQTGTENLWIMHAGPRIASPSPLELLASERMGDLLAELRDFADFIIIDTPPLLTSSDVAALGPLTDGALFVADTRRVQKPMIEAARHELQLLGVPVIGVVVNNYDPRSFRTYGTGYYTDFDREQRTGSDHVPASSIVRAGHATQRTGPRAGSRTTRSS